jgi:hypothetical protein
MIPKWLVCNRPAVLILPATISCLISMICGTKTLVGGKEPLYGFLADVVQVFSSM